MADYGSALAEADFAGHAEHERQVINKWVENVTKERIPELFPKDAIDTSAILVLVNAMALDAPWGSPFDPAQTAPAPFYRLDGTFVQVPMMHYGEYLPSYLGDGVVAVEVPYGGGALSMIVIVPEDFVSFIGDMTAASLDEIVGSIHEGGIHLTLPSGRRGRTSTSTTSCRTSECRPRSVGRLTSPA